MPGMLEAEPDAVEPVPVAGVPLAVLEPVVALALGSIVPLISTFEFT